MAQMSMELPKELMDSINKLSNNVEKMMEEMTQAGAEVVYQNVKNNMKSSFKRTETLEKGLKITKTYKTKTDDGINTKVGFYGYADDGSPIPLIAIAREYGTSRGEKKKSFFRKSFKDERIVTAMKEAQKRYIEDE